MEYTNKLTGKELGVYLGILCGIALVQATGLILDLVVCSIIGFALGTWIDQVARTNCPHHNRWLEEE